MRINTGPDCTLVRLAINQTAHDVYEPFALIIGHAMYGEHHTLGRRLDSFTG